MKQLLIVGLGGAIGSIARFLVSKLNLHWHFLSIPMGTLTVNVLGSLLIGFIAGVSARTEVISPSMRLFLMVGICGGFTTFSSFTNENLTLMQNGQFLSVLLYTGFSIFFGFLAVYLGYVASNL
ncbi:camphor resistance protein CrcB [Paludibacter propionicigenes WB4]|uniref:Fluoride-specific ion channel FluC n=1 Tax=Paludibacter propionicigenes (strain DSM 17365 / JCM 13257 / WB4) TaxID=694427 RepID=E4T0Z0_PALPW|nr:fluoride efflux transporter CrcB [Paludibacter propionicigenes]ADQ78371.1 camphor resistance protein CrcB [Paludibacter propionicigenes WB4]